MSKQQNKIYPTHTNEALLFWTIRQQSILNIIDDVCCEFFQKYETLPDLVFVNCGLMKQLDKEVACGGKQLCVDFQDIIWFYSSQTAQRVLPHAQYVVVAHTQMPGKSCTL